MQLPLLLLAAFLSISHGVRYSQKTRSDGDRVCTILEKAGQHQFGIQFVYATSTNGKCSPVHCSTFKFFGNKLFEILEAKFDNKQCTCSLSPEFAPEDNQSHKLFIYRPRLGEAECSPKKCWSHYGEVRFAIETRKGIRLSAGAMLDSMNHWTPSCMDAADAPAFNFPSIADIAKGLREEGLEDLLDDVDIVQETEAPTDAPTEAPTDAPTGAPTGNWPPKKGTTVYYIGEDSDVFEDGTVTLYYGGRGEILLEDGEGEFGEAGKVGVKLERAEDDPLEDDMLHLVEIELLSLEEPPRCFRGVCVGDEVQYTGQDVNLKGIGSINNGDHGTVTGPAYEKDSIRVRWDTGTMTVLVTDIQKTADQTGDSTGDDEFDDKTFTFKPSGLTGFISGDLVYYVGEPRTYTDTDGDDEELVPGEQVMVIGVDPTDPAKWRVAVDEDVMLSVSPDQISKEEPEISPPPLS